ncbi:MAG: aldo/keto reductase [Vicinamibacterales bacterium]
MQTVALGPDFVASRLAKGNWQLAEKHGAPFDRDAALDAMRQFVEAGITHFDCADHYVGVEPLIGEFKRRYPSLARVLRVSTKICPDLERLPHVTRGDIEALVDRSLERLGGPRLDLVQFHWWDYSVPRYVEAMHWLQSIQQAGKIALLGTTNFDTARLDEIVSSGVRLATNQLQYSLLDDRPGHGMIDFCATRGIQLLCYGTVAGGFLSERWLGAPDPQPPFSNRSLIKYRLIIDDFGGWPLVQELLAVAADIARKHEVDIASVAIRYVLDKPQVATALVGARDAGHLAALLRADRLRLDDEDRSRLAAVTNRAQGPRGDCYTLEREPGGRHSSIMWKNQNTHGAPANSPHAPAGA